MAPQGAARGFRSFAGRGILILSIAGVVIVIGVHGMVGFVTGAWLRSGSPTA